MNHTREISCEEGVLTAMRVTGVKTPPGFVGNVRCDCVTMEICTKTAFYCGIKEGNSEILSLLTRHVLTQLYSLHIFYTRLG